MLGDDGTTATENNISQDSTADSGIEFNTETNADHASTTADSTIGSHTNIEPDRVGQILAELESNVNSDDSFAAVVIPLYIVLLHN